MRIRTMNIAGMLLPRSKVAFLYDDFTLRQVLEKMRYHGYTTIPVITRENRYCGTVSEGDLLWYFMDVGQIDFVKCQEVRLRDVIRLKQDPPIPINMSVKEAMELLVNHSFLPVVDDRDSFVGILTRNAILKKLAASGAFEDRMSNNSRGVPVASAQNT